MSPGHGTPVLRNMRPSDAEDVLELTRQEAWGLGLEDVAIVLELSPGHSVVAELDGRVVAGVTVAVSGPRATLGQVIVDSGHRGRGIGRSMLSAVLGELDRTGVEKVELIGMKGTDSLYEGFGFRAAEGITLLSGPPEPGRQGKEEGFELRPVGREEADELRRLVSRTIGADRWPYVSAFMERAPSLALGLFEGAALRGYIQGRTGGSGNDLGPWVLERPRRSLAERMLSSALHRMGPGKTYSFVPSAQPLSAGLLRGHGISEPLEMKRFVRSRGTGLAPFPESVLAVCSAEFV